ncbi:uncharacterized protein LOC129591184 [Paramacrobiotus metropolitanus]|uniref:uncharacterized protein LOC129591184 n=1 Tax=Paramacrobiotus metropolitanus TaxID=2943436 RepID=UPI002445B249|nr:uncharacterized protein LOC129591184 [Paramacrobiotus metropolitanus]
MRYVIRSKLLQKNSRKYNNFFAMSATGCTGQLIPGTKGLSNLILINGKIYHRMLNGNDPRGPLRFFIHDNTYIREDINKFQLSRTIISQITKTLQTNNPLWSEFQQLYQECPDHARLELTETVSNEIAALIVFDKNEPIQERSIICWKKTSAAPTFIRSTSNLYLPLQYVLICPCGEPGWSPKYKELHNLTQLAFHRQMILRHKILHYFGGLFNEFIVDMYSSVEEKRLDYIRENQLRYIKENDLLFDETINADGPINSSKIYLPDSFPGSKRAQRKRTAEALAIVSHYGNPTFFITCTTNPKWPEITTKLKPGQTAADRPDIVTRVFNAKKNLLINNAHTILNGKSKIYCIEVVEFQKRGLPHVHIALKVQQEPPTMEEIDALLSAEMPPESDTEVYELVTTYSVPFSTLFQDRHYQQLCSMT